MCVFYHRSDPGQPLFIAISEDNRKSLCHTRKSLCHKGLRDSREGGENDYHVIHKLSTVVKKRLATSSYYGKMHT